MITRPKACFAIAAMCCLHAAGASAATISLGSYIVLAPDVFVVPVTIADGTNVAAWQFDLSYDPLDVQVDTACDPFNGNPYCSLLTGPVTEGEFFASGAPFNLLNPGFIDLDPVTFAQTGLLFGANGAFGGFAPLPSGDGTLAFVQFTILGDGSSVITVDGSVETAVPEPSTLVLLTTALLLPAARRQRRRHLRNQRSHS